MAVEEKDPVSGQKTTGHEWNGIKELDTPVPLGILIFIVVTHVWALLWWVLMPTFPLGTTYTKGILDTDQRKIVELDLTEAQAQRAARMKAIETSSYEDILANEDLMKLVRTTGHQLFGDNCAACHGEDGKGNREVGAPNLTDQHWVYGGDLQTIINTIHGGRQGHMPTWDERLTPAEIKILSLYVASLGTKQP